MITINEILTDRFILRQVEEQDNESIFEILSDKQTTKYLNIKEIKTIDDVDEIIKDYLEEYAIGNKFPFAIINRKTGRFTGVFLIKLDLYDPDCFEFTVYIKRDYWNQGTYSEVLPYMIDFAFYNIKTSNFRGFIMVSNRSSAKVLKKCGFFLEKTFFVEGLPEKIESYLMTREEYISKKNK